MIVVLGENLVDLLPTGGTADHAGYTAHTGGGPANTAVALGRLGVPVAMVSRLSGDRFGTRCRDRLLAAGVDLRWAASGAEPTPLAVAQVDADGSAAYDFYLQATSEFAWPEDSTPDLPDDAVAVHTGSLLWAVPPAADLVDRVLRRETGRRTLSLDPNVRPVAGSPEHYAARLDAALPLVDVVKLSVDDLAYLRPGADPVELASEWCARGPTLVVVTLGAEGALAVTGSFAVRRQASKVTVVDTVGAGDAFNAGLLAALRDVGRLGPGRLTDVTRDDVTHALERAILVAALTCERPGADPPTAAEVAARSAIHSAQR